MLRPAAPGGKLCPVLQLHTGLQKRLPEYSAGHHGECVYTHIHTQTDRYAVPIVMTAFPSANETFSSPFV